MISIIEFLNKKGFESGSEIYDIQEASRACYSDTTEVVQMLEYITSLGHVRETPEGWLIENNQEYTSRKMFRDYYLKDILKLTTELSTSPKVIEDIKVTDSKLNTNEIKEYLEFLQKITQYGFVKKVKSNWKLESFIPLTQVEN